MREDTQKIKIFLIGVVVAYITGICVGLFGGVKMQEKPYIDVPEEWRAINQDTMEVIRHGDSLYIQFMEKDQEQK